MPPQSRRPFLRAERLRSITRTPPENQNHSPELKNLPSSRLQTLSPSPLPPAHLGRAARAALRGEAPRPPPLLPPPPPLHGTGRRSRPPPRRAPSPPAPSRSASRAGGSGPGEQRPAGLPSLPAPALGNKRAGGTAAWGCPPCCPEGERGPLGSPCPARKPEPARQTASGFGTSNIGFACGGTTPCEPFTRRKSSQAIAGSSRPTQLRFCTALFKIRNPPCSMNCFSLDNCYKHFLSWCHSSSTK